MEMIANVQNEFESDFSATLLLRKTKWITPTVIRIQSVEHFHV